MLKLEFRSGLTAEPIEVVVNTYGHVVRGPAEIEDMVLRGFYTGDEKFVPNLFVEEVLARGDSYEDIWGDLYIALPDEGIGEEVHNIKLVPNAEEVLSNIIHELNTAEVDDVAQEFLYSLGRSYNEYLELLELSVLKEEN